MKRRLKVLLATLAMMVGMVIVAPSADASTSYYWVHPWDYTGNGVTVQYSQNNFTRTSYVHGSTCTEQKLEFWPSGALAMYYRYSSTSSCSGKTWLLLWHPATAGTYSSLSWQSDLNWVLRNSSGTAVWASGTNRAGTTERMTLATNTKLYLDHYELCCFWVNDRTYPS